MENLFRILQTALPVLAALALGVLCRKLNFLTRDGVDTLKKVVVNLTLPAVVFAAFATAEYSLQTIAIPVLVFLLCCLGLVLGRLLARLLRLPGRVTPYLAAGFEAGMLGYALFALLFPQASSAKFAILDLGQTLFVFTLYKALLSGGKETKSLWKDIVNTPILWGTFAGLLVGATGLFAWMVQNGSAAVVTSLTDFLSAPTGMMILLAVGYDLDFGQIRWRETARFVVLRLAAMAILFAVLLLVNRTLLHGIIFEGAALLLFILPPPYVLPIFADEPSQRAQISSALSALTVVTLLFFAVMTVAM
ncbi:MAG TPA: AEC family transporter [Candidatus Avoscillospira stercorigallinarum]|uniref:AEC family transporter n=1 Tax=Candidatus Avoscillospira stercorigallinarum TaxID=2840708 RepID=A0A9D0Z8J0_9FIRM|nr:AEC family transporter [Candidatus Avoscillospira stercorigallinarum]